MTIKDFIGWDYVTAIITPLRINKKSMKEVLI